MGLRDVSREADPQGASTGEFGVQMRTRDMARLALLYLRGGEWNGRQLVSRDWVARMFAPTVSMGMGAAHYADQLWSMLERGVFMAVGFHRQILLVMPRYGIAAAFPGRKHWAFAPWMDLLELAAKTPSAVFNQRRQPGRYRCCAMNASFSLLLRGCPPPPIAGRHRRAVRSGLR